MLHLYDWYFSKHLILLLILNFLLVLTGTLYMYRNNSMTFAYTYPLSILSILLILFAYGFLRQYRKQVDHFSTVSSFYSAI